MSICAKIALPFFCQQMLRGALFKKSDKTTLTNAKGSSNYAIIAVYGRALWMLGVDWMFTNMILTHFRTFSKAEVNLGVLVMALPTQPSPFEKRVWASKTRFRGRVPKLNNLWTDSCLLNWPTNSLPIKRSWANDEVRQWHFQSRLITQHSNAVSHI